MSKPKKMPAEYVGRDLAPLIAAAEREPSEHGTEVLIIDARFADAIEVALTDVGQRLADERERCANEVLRAKRAHAGAAAGWAADMAMGQATDEDEAALAASERVMRALSDVENRIRALGPAPRAEAPQPAPSQPGDVRAWGERVAHLAVSLTAMYPKKHPDELVSAALAAAGPAPQPAPSETVALAIAKEWRALADTRAVLDSDLAAIVRRHLADAAAAVAEHERALVRRKGSVFFEALSDADCDAIREAVRS